MLPRTSIRTFAAGLVAAGPVRELVRCSGDEIDRHLSSDEIDALTARSVQALPSVAEARKSEVLLIKGLLSPDEVKAIVSMDRSRCGTTARNAEGIRQIGSASWTTW